MSLRINLSNTILEDRIAGRVAKGKKPTKEFIKKQVASALSGQHMKKLIETNVSEHNGIPTLDYILKSDAYSALADTYLGKNIIITDNHNWFTEDIVITYRSQYIIKDVFKQMKDRKTGTWWSMFHWTDKMMMWSSKNRHKVKLLKI